MGLGLGLRRRREWEVFEVDPFLSSVFIVEFVLDVDRGGRKREKV